VTTTRFTKQRAELLALLDDIGAFRTPLQIYRELRVRGATVGLTTVYRNLQWLYDAGEVDAMRMPTGEQLFRRCGSAHHHHLVCRACAAAVEVRSAAMERWAETTGSDNGFIDVSHTLEIFGLCSHCSPRRPRH
jgi:Fur family transcriptional regulator, ferric uptake regulator